MLASRVTCPAQLVSVKRDVKYKKIQDHPQHMGLKEELMHAGGETRASDVHSCQVQRRKKRFMLVGLDVRVADVSRRWLDADTVDLC